MKKAEDGMAERCTVTWRRGKDGQGDKRYAMFGIISRARERLLWRVISRCIQLLGSNANIEQLNEFWDELMGCIDVADLVSPVNVQ